MESTTTNIVFSKVVTGMTVIICGQPAACMGDPQICTMFDGPKPHVGGDHQGKRNGDNL